VDGLLFLLLLVILGFAAGFLDSCFGIGYGTALTPMLILLNLPILEAIPAVLFSHIIASAVTAVAYQLHGNVHFSLSSEDSKIAAALSITGVVGAALAVFIFLLFFCVNPAYLQIYIGITVLLVGILVLANIRWNFSWPRIATLGVVAGFNKSLTGGGYASMVTGGQLMSGRESKEAIGSTTIPKAIISTSALLLYILLGRFLLNPLFFQLAIPLTVGAAISAPIASYLVKRASTKRMSKMIGVAIVTLGTLTLLKSISNVIP